jgi:hypothetical protein
MIWTSNITATCGSGSNNEISGIGSTIALNFAVKVIPRNKRRGGGSARTSRPAHVRTLFFRKLFVRTTFGAIHN